jgi:hypothetical protein
MPGVPRKGAFMTDPITVQQYERAERAVALEEERRGFAFHAGTYLVGNALLIAYNLFIVPEFIWFPFPLVVWGIGLLMHYVFGVRMAPRNIAQRQALIEQRGRQMGEMSGRGAA